MWIAVALAIFIGVLSSSAFNLGDDNPIEEASEEIIECYTGIDIDLSPDSKEH